MQGGNTEVPLLAARPARANGWAEEDRAECSMAEATQGMDDQGKDKILYMLRRDGIVSVTRN